MKNENYTESEALALVGRVFASLVEFFDARVAPDGRIPLGTRASVEKVQSSALGGYEVELKWALAPLKRGMRGTPLRVFFGKDAMSLFMQEIKS